MSFIKGLGCKLTKIEEARKRLASQQTLNTTLEMERTVTGQHNSRYGIGSLSPKRIIL
ncbi:hypothetical protein YC2023_073281 [Brassica napus]